MTIRKSMMLTDLATRGTTIGNSVLSVYIAFCRPSSHG